MENIWAFIENQLWQNKSETHDQDDVWEFGNHTWYSDILDTIIPKLYNSLPSRLVQILKRIGGQTDY